MSDNAARPAPHQSGQRPLSVLDHAPLEPAYAYWLNVHQLCDGDLTYLERKQAEQRIIEELASE